MRTYEEIETIVKGVREGDIWSVDASLGNLTRAYDDVTKKPSDLTPEQKNTLKAEIQKSRDYLAEYVAARCRDTESIAA